MSSPGRVFQLSGTCNNYPWGKKGRESLAARLCEKTPGTGFSIKDDEPYSEMWFGDYPDYPGRVLETGEPLADALQRDKEALLGGKAIRDLGGQLPFLPKILSIAKALPLQIHPDKSLAERLHARDPGSYADPNHKPEIAVALSSRFEVFAGWKPLREIEPFFALPALRRFVPGGSGATAEAGSWTDATLREASRALLKADAAEVERIVDGLLDDGGGRFGGTANAHVPALVPRLRAQYGAGDPGILVALLCMNFLVLERGQALFIPADGIHAYLSGDIVECMARSNNVLNSGFCPPADRGSADLFADALTFAPHSKHDMELPSRPSERGARGRTQVYAPPMSEFDMLRVDLAAGQTETVKAGQGPGVAIVTRGAGRLEADGRTFDAQEGFIFFIAHGVEACWESTEEMQIFIAVV